MRREGWCGIMRMRDRRFGRRRFIIEVCGCGEGIRGVSCDTQEEEKEEEEEEEEEYPL